MHEGRHEHGGMTSSDVIDTRSAILSSGIGEGQSVLDLGCSIGDYAIEASKFVGNGIVYGMDAHENSIRLLGERIRDLGIENIKVMHVDVTRGIPLADGSIDRILVFNVLHGFAYNGEYYSVLKEMERVLAREGIVSIIESRPGAVGKGPSEEVRLTNDRISELMALIDLKMIERSEISPYHDIFLFSR